MRMIDGISKEGIKNGFGVAQGLLAAWTEAAACWGDASSSYVKKG